MFKRQIDLLTKLISDWEQGNLETNWDLTKGLCTNCKLGFDTFIYEFGYSLENTKIFLDTMYQGFSNYTGNIYYPICTKEEYFPNPQQPPFVFKTELRLALAKHCLNYLKSL